MLDARRCSYSFNSDRKVSLKHCKMMAVVQELLHPRHLWKTPKFVVASM